MKVLLFIYNFEIGGAQKIMIQYANLLSKKLTNRIVLCVLQDHGLLRELVCNEVEIVTWKSDNKKFGVMQIVKSIIHYKPDIVISSFPVISIYLLLFKYIAAFKYKLIVREATTPSKYKKKFKGVKNIIILIILKKIMKYCDALIAPSYGVKEDMISYLKIPSEKIAVIYNPVVDYIEKKIHSGGKIFEPVKICFFGRIDPIKRLEIQILTINILRTNYHIDCRLDIYGPVVDLNYFSTLKVIIEKHSLEEIVKFEEPVSNIRKLLPQYDIMLLTSIVEGLPSILIEGLFAGIKIVACDCPNGPKEILKNGEFGSLIPFEECTPKVVAENIRSLFLNDRLLDEQSLNSHLLNFSEQGFLTSFENLVNKIAPEIRYQ